MWYNTKYSVINAHAFKKKSNYKKLLRLYDADDRWNASSQSCEKEPVNDFYLISDQFNQFSHIFNEKFA